MLMPPTRLRRERYLVYVHFADLPRQMVEGIFVHPLEFPTAGRALMAERSWKATLTPYLQSGSETGGQSIAVDAQSPQQAFDQVVRFGVQQGWKGLIFCQRQQLNAVGA